MNWLHAELSQLFQTICQECALIRMCDECETTFCMDCGVVEQLQQWPQQRSCCSECHKTKCSDDSMRGRRGWRAKAQQQAAQPMM